MVLKSSPRTKLAGMSHSRHFDIVLVVNYFRSATHFLCIIEALSSKYRIGLHMTPLDEDMRRKAGDAQERFVAECLARGAELADGGGHDVNLMIVQQRLYDDAAVAAVFERFSPRRVVGLMALAMAGLPAHERYLKQFGIDKVYVPNRRLMEFLLEQRDAAHIYRGIDVEQIGYPYDRWPLVPEFETDWLIAAPTGFSFRRESDQHHFFKDVLSLLEQIGPEDRIVYKPHNSERRDYLAPPGYAKVARLVGRIPGANAMLALLSRVRGWVGRHFTKLYTAFLHERVLRRSRPLADLSDKEWMGLEAFLPGVRKGVIGGLSNTIWGTLYFGLPFLNCVDIERRDSNAASTLHGSKDSSGLLDLNLKFFGVEYCGGRLEEAAHGEGIVLPEDRQGDLVAAIGRDLAQISCRLTCAR